MEEEIQEKLPKIEPTIKPPPQIFIWILVVIGSLVAMVGGIYLGLGAGKRYISQPVPTLDLHPSESIIPTSSTTPSIAPDLTDKKEYVIDFSNTRAITANDLTNLTPWKLKVARNEIYARHGRSFVHQDLSCYFDKQSWYQLNQDYSESNLTKLETSNVIFILNFEKKINSPLINKDSGCNQQS